MPLIAKLEAFFALKSLSKIKLAVIARIKEMKMAQEAKSYPYKEPRLVDYDGDLTKDWYFIYYIWSTDTQDLVRKRVLVTGKTLAQRRSRAKQEMAEILQMLKEGYTVGKVVKKIGIDLNTFTLIQAIDFAIEKKNSFVREKTKKDYRTFRNIFTKWLTGKDATSLLLKDVSTDLVFDFFDYLKEVREVANKTFNNYHTNFAALLNVLVGRKIIKDNPCDCINKLPTQSQGHTPLTPEQIERIKEAILKRGDVQLYLFISFCYYTLARPYMEVATLKISHIRDKTIFIEGGSAKNRKSAHIIIPSGLAAIIDEYKLRSYPPNFYIFGWDREPGPRKLFKDSLYNRHAAILKKLGMFGTGYDVYGYKHTAVINLFKAGVDIKDIQRQCRHSSISMTDKYLRDLGMFRNDEILLKYPTF